jgi:hypothetical protein
MVGSGAGVCSDSVQVSLLVQRLDSPASSGIWMFRRSLALPTF